MLSCLYTAEGLRESKGWCSFEACLAFLVDIDFACFNPGTALLFPLPLIP